MSLLVHTECVGGMPDATTSSAALKNMSSTQSASVLVGEASAEPSAAQVVSPIGRAGGSGSWLEPAPDCSRAGARSPDSGAFSLSSGTADRVLLEQPAAPVSRPSREDLTECPSGNLPDLVDGDGMGRCTGGERVRYPSEVHQRCQGRRGQRESLSWISARTFLQKFDLHSTNEILANKGQLGIRI